MVEKDDVEKTVFFFRYMEESDFYAVSELLADNFRFFGPLPDPFDKNVWLSFQKAIQHAFPDWKYHLKKVEKMGDAVEVTVEITGTHLKELTLPWPLVKPIPPSGTKIYLPEEKVILKFKNGQLHELHIYSSPHGGFPGLMEQLRVE
ncbi:MAG: nuclear transport factor 2 family protein [Waddliaceae bacterium]